MPALHTIRYTASAAQPSLPPASIMAGLASCERRDPVRHQGGGDGDHSGLSDDVAERRLCFPARVVT